MSLVMLVYVVIGATLGFVVYRFVGCRSGACPIWANPYIATLYGAFLGLLLGTGR